MIKRCIKKFFARGKPAADKHCFFPFFLKNFLNIGQKWKNEIVNSKRKENINGKMLELIFSVKESFMHDRMQQLF